MVYTWYLPSVTLGLGDSSKAVVTYSPLRVDFYSGWVMFKYITSIPV